MIKIKKVDQVRIKTKASYALEERTYNIESELMSDECKGYRIAQNAFLWLTDKGYLGEIESIYPKTIDIPPYRFSPEIRREKGFPQLELVSYQNEVSIQHHEGGFTIWLIVDKTVDYEVISNNISFLASGNQLVAIGAKEASIESSNR